MADYIDREKLIRDLIDKGFYPALVKRAIENTPTEDVVPRSEYDAVVSAVDNSTKEFLKLHDAYQNQKREFEAELDKAKQEFAWEIFEKIEDLFFDKYLLGNITASLFEYKYAELKKKYKGKDTDVPTNIGE